MDWIARNMRLFEREQSDGEAKKEPTVLRWTTPEQMHVHLDKKSKIKFCSRVQRTC